MKAPVSLSPEELLALLACARKRRLRDWTAVLICYRCGLRRSELLDIRARDIQDGCLTIQRLKGSEKTQQLLQWHPEPLLHAKSWIGSFPYLLNSTIFSTKTGFSIPVNCNGKAFFVATRAS